MVGSLICWTRGMGKDEVSARWMAVRLGGLGHGLG